ncbi:hypothetical protein EGW08_011762 [Elysia chlorotica]|uniref:Uncharacterized protein n=1 Tax=Elysia chlorotica TaxID=188477 RepID=A0A433TG18_ELYCH|nr:hypothetical protein EGW08_011762 [Elysia chlorotica]
MLVDTGLIIQCKNMKEEDGRAASDGPRTSVVDIRRVVCQRPRQPGLLRRYMRLARLVIEIPQRSQTFRHTESITCKQARAQLSPPIHQPTNQPTHQPTHQPTNPPSHVPSEPSEPVKPPVLTRDGTVADRAELRAECRVPGQANPFTQSTQQPTNPATQQPTNPPTHQPSKPVNPVKPPVLTRDGTVADRAELRAECRVPGQANPFTQSIHQPTNPATHQPM